jgi:carbohydrate diacid regulator
MENKLLKREDFYLSSLTKNNLKPERARAFGIENVKCTIILIYAKKRIDDLAEVIAHFLTNQLDLVIKTGDNTLILFKFKDKSVSAYKSLKEFAELLRQFCYEETGVNFSAIIGKTVESVLNAKESYDFIKMAEKINPAILSEQGVYLAEEFSFNALLENLGKEKALKFFPSINGEKIIKLKSSAELLNTAKVFLDSDLNACLASRKLFIHRNTLSYRLNKIESLTGLNLRKFSEAVIFNAVLKFLKEE